MNGRICCYQSRCIYVDCTLGGAGHAHAVGERLSPQGMIVGLDQDEDALDVARQRLSDLSCQVMTITLIKFFKFKTCFARTRHLRS